MNILFISAEAAPFAKVGGLGDVIAAGSLPTALRQLDVDARVILPLYGTIDRAKFNIKPQFSFYFPRSNGTAFVQVYRTDWRDVPFYFVESWPFFGEEDSVYTEWSWDMPRYIFFSQVAMAVAWELRQRQNWAVDVLHVNDWHTGLIPFFLEQSRIKPEWADVRSMITIHNMAHQGNYAGGWLWDLDVPERNHPGLQSLGLHDNLLAVGVAYSDYVTTVSPRHAEEIQYPYMGYGLFQLVRSRTYENRLYGVLNGIDTQKFDPATDPYIAENYTIENFIEARRENKRRLQTYAGLEQREDVPVIGLVSRLVWQKGIDIAATAMRQILAERDVQFSGTGNRRGGTQRTTCPNCRRLP
jgi:starch synthase